MCSNKNQKSNANFNTAKTKLIDGIGTNYKSLAGVCKKNKRINNTQKMQFSRNITYHDKQ